MYTIICINRWCLVMWLCVQFVICETKLKSSQTVPLVKDNLTPMCSYTDMWMTDLLLSFLQVALWSAYVLLQGSLPAWSWSPYQVFQLPTTSHG